MSHLSSSARTLPFRLTALGIELTILCWIVVGSVQPVGAQSPNHDLSPQASRTAWVGIGIGPGVISEGASGDSNQSGAVSGILYGSVRNGPHLFSARLSMAAEVFGDAVSDFGVLYGRAVEAENGFASIAAGIAGVNGSYDEDGPQILCGFLGECELDPPEKFTTIGLPLDVQLMWRPIGYVGIGLSGYANLNAKASFAGVSLSLQIGRLR